MTAPSMPLPAAHSSAPARLRSDAALLLDLDGTLLDIAPTPMSVRVPPGLPQTLRRLRSRLDDALAVVTGRPIEQVDALLGDLPYRGRGRAWRRDPPRARRCSGSPAFADAAARLAACGGPARRLASGRALERKERGFVLHYRAVPAAGPEIGLRLVELVAQQAASFDLMPASMAWEVRPRGADKGTAVRD